jgi:hypothetical protein
MPTSKPRITVTLTEEQHAILRQISAAGGQSMSGVISDFMLMAQPALERMAVALQQLKQDRDSDRQLVADMLSQLHAERARKSEEVPALSSKSPNAAWQAVEHASPTAGMEPDALQFCASVDFIRADTNRTNDSLGDDIEINPTYTKQKRSTSPRTRNSASAAKGAPKRPKK